MLVASVLCTFHWYVRNFPYKLTISTLLNPLSAGLISLGVVALSQFFIGEIVSSDSQVLANEYLGMAERYLGSFGVPSVAALTIALGGVGFIVAGNMQANLAKELPSECATSLLSISNWLPLSEDVAIRKKIAKTDALASIRPVSSALVIFQHVVMCVGVLLLVALLAPGLLLLLGVLTGLAVGALMVRLPRVRNFQTTIASNKARWLQEVSRLQLNEENSVGGSTFVPLAIEYASLLKYARWISTVVRGTVLTGGMLGLASLAVFLNATIDARQAVVSAVSLILFSTSLASIMTNLATVARFEPALVSVLRSLDCLRLRLVPEDHVKNSGGGPIMTLLSTDSVTYSVNDHAVTLSQPITRNEAKVLTADLMVPFDLFKMSVNDTDRVVEIESTDWEIESE